MTADFAKWRELETIYGVQDLYNMFEVAAVNASNQRLAMKER